MQFWVYTWYTPTYPLVMYLYLSKWITQKISNINTCPHRDKPLAFNFPIFSSIEYRALAWCSVLTKAWFVSRYELELLWCLEQSQGFHQQLPIPRESVICPTLRDLVLIMSRVQGIYILPCSEGLRFNSGQHLGVRIMPFLKDLIVSRTQGVRTTPALGDLDFEDGLRKRKLHHALLQMNQFLEWPAHRENVPCLALKNMLSVTAHE